MLTEIEKPVGRPASNTALRIAELHDDSNTLSDISKSNQKVSPRSCPKFEKCSAPICSLDTDWHKREHIKGERVCLYLREFGKTASLPKLKGAIPTKLLQVMVTQRPLICTAYTSIKRQLKKSALNGSKIIQPGIHYVK